MRKITKRALHAVLSRNTLIGASTNTHVLNGCMYVHNRRVLRHVRGKGFFVSFCGVNSALMRERLNGLFVLLGYSERYRFVMNGNDIMFNGKPININKMYDCKELMK